MYKAIKLLLKKRKEKPNNKNYMECMKNKIILHRTR